MVSRAKTSTRSKPWRQQAPQPAQLSAATGREITYVPVTPDDFRRGALAAGLPEWLVEALGLLNDTLAAGGFAGVTNVVREVGKAEPRTFAQFAREYAEEFKSREP